MADIIGGSQQSQGATPHGDADAGNPNKGGFKSINHGTDPTEVANDGISDAYADRQGMPYGMLGHPAPIGLEYQTSGNDVQTNDPIIDSIGVNQRIIVLACTAMVHASTSKAVKVRIGFGTSTVPAEPASGASVTGMALSHPAITKGSGLVYGMGGSRWAVGGLGEELRITSTATPNGGLTVFVSYYVIDEA